MNTQKKRFVIIKMAYWLGIAADALWAVGLFFPQVFGMLTGNPDFAPDIQTRLITQRHVTIKMKGEQS